MCAFPCGIILIVTEDLLLDEKSFHVWKTASRTAYIHGLFKSGEEISKMYAYVCLPSPAVLLAQERQPLHKSFEAEQQQPCSDTSHQKTTRLGSRHGTSHGKVRSVHLW